jgi:hypothetical protein
MFVLPIKYFWDLQPRGKYWLNSFEFLGRKHIIRIISEFNKSIISSFQKPRNHKHYFFLGTIDQILQLSIVLLLVTMWEIGRTIKIYIIHI